jgi:hypothetical protein
VSSEITLDASLLSDDFVSVKTISSRQLSRKPSLISAVKPGESVQVPDRQGGLVLTRSKKHVLTPAEMLAELYKLSAGAPPMDTKTFLEEGE